MNEEELAALKESNPKAYELITGLKSENDKLKKPANPPADDKGGKGDEGDAGLRDKAAKDRADVESRKGESKRLENALKFNLNLSTFVKDNGDVLPAEIQDILKVSEKESYDSAVEKASAIKTAFIQSFFAVQANMDLLTANQKSQVEDYLKLTKNGKESKSEAIFENILEPVLETMRKVKKAEELGKSRSNFATPSKVEDGYKARLIAGSRKTYLGEKGESKQ